MADTEYDAANLEELDALIPSDDAPETPAPEPVKEPAPTPEPEPSTEEGTKEKDTNLSDTTPVPETAEEPVETAPKFLSKKARENWRALEDKAKANETRAKQLEMEIQQLRQASESVPKEVDTELAELRKWRAMLDYQNTPQYVDQYVKPIEANEAGLVAKLAELGLPEDALEKIKREGSDAISSKWWNEQVLQKLDQFDRLSARQIEQALLKTQELRKGQKDAVLNAESGVQQYIKEQEIQRETYQKQWTSTEEQEIKGFLSQFPDAKILDVPPGASQEEKERIEAHNAKFGEYITRDSQMIEGIRNGDPVVMTQMRLLANSAFYFKDQLVQYATALKERDEQIKELTTRVNGIKAATSVKPSAQTQTKPKEDRNIFGMSDLEAIDAGLAELG